MKKEEAMTLAPQRSKLVIEYIEQILSDKEKVEGEMNFSSYKIDGQSMCTLDIYVPEQNLEKHLNMGITSDHCDILYEQLFTDLLDTFLEHETMGVSRYFTIKFGMGQNFTGIHAINATESQIKLNFLRKGQKFDEIVNNYNTRINDYVNNVSYRKTEEEPKVGSR